MLLQDLFRGEESLVTATSEATIRDVVAKMQKANVGAVVLTNEDKVAGIVTDRDIALNLGSGAATVDTPISQIMTREVHTIWADQGVFNATQYFEGYKVRRLPVIDRNDKLVGMVTVDDLFALFARELFNIARAIEPSLVDKF